MTLEVTQFVAMFLAAFYSVVALFYLDVREAPQAQSQGSIYDSHGSKLLPALVEPSDVSAFPNRDLDCLCAAPIVSGDGALVAPRGKLASGLDFA